MKPIEAIRGAWCEAALWMTVGGLFALAALQIPQGNLTANHDPGPRALPLAMALALLTGGIVQLVVAVWHRLPKALPAQYESQLESRQSRPNRVSTRALAGMISIVVYGSLSPWTGFWLATVAFLVGWLAWFRRPVVEIVVIPALLTAVIVIVFGNLFEVQLPRGWASLSGRYLPIDVP